MNDTPNDKDAFDKAVARETTFMISKVAGEIFDTLNKENQILQSGFSQFTYPLPPLSEDTKDLAFYAFRAGVQHMLMVLNVTLAEVAQTKVSEPMKRIKYVENAVERTETAYVNWVQAVRCAAGLTKNRGSY